MDGVEGAGPLPSSAGARAGRARPDQSYLDAGVILTYRVPPIYLIYGSQGTGELGPPFWVLGAEPGAACRVHGG